ncbi:MAG: hypothetical protein D6719_11160 [Candidatus Dadabacteria bacterium]|nr:MAG: hypothetical protein D6719_11160 [Candidatus Dadabacteria bacterium]
MQQDSRDSHLSLLIIIVLTALVYYVARLPALKLPLAYYDDGETLYHTMVILKGYIPYRDDFNHHFAGYLLPFLLTAKITGYSLNLIYQTAFWMQLLYALAIYGTARFYSTRSTSAIITLLAVTAREPWILGYYVQQELNTLYALILYFSVRFLNEQNNRSLYISAVLSGLAFCFDQRAVFYSLILLSAYYLKRPKSLSVIIKSVACWLSAPLAGLYYLVRNHILRLFLEQTIVFPFKYRSASAGILETLKSFIAANYYLITLTPLLLFLALVGLLGLTRLISKEKRPDYQLLLASLLPPLLMTLWGARDYDYYSVVWFPSMALLALFIPWAFPGLIRKNSWILNMILVLPLIFTFLNVIVALRDPSLKNYSGDGINQVVSYLRETVQPEDSLLLWGYRLEILARLEKINAYPFANQIMIHPDEQISKKERRIQHVYPKYERIFLSLLAKAPPDYVLVFNRGTNMAKYSRANNALIQLLSERYQQIYSLSKPDFTGKRCYYTLYVKSVSKTSSVN